jgi:hypothetical protein
MNQPVNPADFPELPDSNQTSSKKGSGSFINQLKPNDSLTVANGFINGVRKHVKGDRTLYFVSVGIFQGSTLVGDDYKGNITNFDVLAGSTLERWMSSLADVENPLKGVRFRLEFRNLKFIPRIHEGKAFVDSFGILETVQVGYLIK